MEKIHRENNSKRFYHCPRCGCYIQGIIGPTGPRGPKGCAGPQGLRGYQGCIGPTGPRGHRGLKGTTGPCGCQGPTGPTGTIGPTLDIYLGSNTVANDGDYLGLGIDGNNFQRSSVVVPLDATITGLAFSIRDESLSAGDTVTGEIYRYANCTGPTTGSPSGVIVSISGPTTSCCAFTSANIPVNQCDLLSVKVGLTGIGSLTNGAAATILLTSS
jgi:hypothetical protein